MDITGPMQMMLWKSHEGLLQGHCRRSLACMVLIPAWIKSSAVRRTADQGRLGGCVSLIVDSVGPTQLV